MVLQLYKVSVTSSLQKKYLESGFFIAVRGQYSQLMKMHNFLTFGKYFMYLKIQENTKIIYILHLKQHMEMQRAKEQREWTLKTSRQCWVSYWINFS